MSINEKGTTQAGLQIVTKPAIVRSNTQRSEVLSTIEDEGSVNTLTPTHTTENAISRDASPLSPFYSHPTTRTSLDAMKSESKQQFALYETDLEAAISETKTNMRQVCTNATSPGRTKEDCSTWPGQRTQKQRLKAEKRARSCSPLARFDKRTQVIIKVVIGLILIGLILGVGLGISKAVGGGVFHSNQNVS